MLVVVGGQGRGAGKTAVIAGLICAIPEASWTAVKISGHAHGRLPERGFELVRQARGDATDAGRYLAAGAVEAYWLRTAEDSLRMAVPAIQRLRCRGGHLILESNRVLEYLEPDLYLAVFDELLAEVKPSCRRFLPRADALVLVERTAAEAAWRRLLPPQVPQFRVRPPAYESPALTEFVRARAARRRESAWCR